MKNIFFSIISAFFAMTAFATAQIPESIFYDGKDYGLHSLPLEQLPMIDSIRMLFTDKVPSTGNYRGYRGYWSVRNDSLFLDSVMRENASGPSEKYDISKEIGGELPVFASWVSDTLHVVGGNCVFYVHDGWMSKFETNIYLGVDKGKVKEIKRVNNEKIQGERENSDIVNILSKFAEENCPWLESGQRIVIEAKYVEADTGHKPSRTKIKIIKLPGGLVLTKRQKQELIEKLDRLMIEERMMPAAWVDGKLWCATWTFPILMP